MKKGLIIAATLFLGLGAINEVVATDNHAVNNAEVEASWDYVRTVNAYAFVKQGAMSVKTTTTAKIYENSYGEMRAQRKNSDNMCVVRYSDRSGYDYMFTDDRTYYFNM